MLIREVCVRRIAMGALAFQSRHSAGHQHRHEISVYEAGLKDQADGQDDDGERPRACQPGAAPEHAARPAGILDPHPEALQQEVERSVRHIPIGP